MQMSSVITIKNSIRELSAPARVIFCDSFLCRLRGLMFRSKLHPDEGLLLVEKQDSRLEAAIHMLFVPFDLSIFWINAQLIVVDKIVARRWHLAYVPKNAARYILELHPNRMSDYEIGDKVEFVHVD